MKKSYSIIGSGVGALTAGAILARQGHSVTVYEKFGQLGGYATLFKRKGFTFDVSLHQLGGVHTGGLNKILRASGIYDRLNYVQHRSLTEIETTEGEVLSIPNGDPRALEAMLIKKFPNEKKGISKWFRVMKQYGDQTLLHSNRVKSPLHQAVIDLFAPILLPRVLSGSFRNVTLGDTCKIEDPKLWKLLTHFSLYYGLPKEESNQLFSMLVKNGYYFHGGYYVKGGGHQVARELAKVIEENGGTVHLKSEVTAVQLENNRATSLTINGGKEVPVENVIMGGSPHLLYGKLLNGHERAKRALDKMAGNQISLTASVLYIGLDCPIGQLNPELAESYLYTKESPLSEAEFYTMFQEKRDFEGDYSQWPLEINIQSNIDPDCLPESGGSCFHLFVADNYERWDALSPEEYRKQKEIETEKLLNLLEEKLPGVRDHIVVKELGTPKTMQRFTGNPKGAFYGFAQDLPQTMFRRMSSKSVVKNIEFASAWTRPGGGYEGAMESGFMLAHKSKVSGFVIMGVMIALMNIVPHLL